MKRNYFLCLFLFFFQQACGQSGESSNIVESTSTSSSIIKKEESLIDPSGSTIKTRFNLPAGFTRETVDSGSFAYYLRNLPLKAHGSKVTYYNGGIKENYGVYDAVVAMDIGKKDLQQCADAVMRLRAEYLYHTKQYNKIHFNFTNGFRVDYTEWKKGKRVKIEGNKTYWVSSTTPSNSYQDFRKYMELIFMYAGTLSLSKELKPISLQELAIGDVFIQGGSPGHAVIVVDKAFNPTTGERIFMLAQSYMPAQDIQILQNPENKELSPWYSTTVGNNLIATPEWQFSVSDLKRFADY